MSTELKEATIKVVLDTRKAVEQAEKQGEEEERARATGRDRQQRRDDGAQGRGNGSGASRGGRGRDGGRDDDERDPWRAGGRLAFGAARATANGELWGLLRGTVPYLAAAELAARWAPGIIGGFDANAGGAMQQIAQEVEKLKARLEAIGDTQQQLQKIAVLQLRLDGQIDPGNFGAMASKLYAINSALNQQRLQEDLLGGYISRKALTSQFLDVLRDATGLGGGK